MSDDDRRTSRYERLRRIEDADLPGLTVLRARRFLARYPDHAPCWVLLGRALLELARYDEAVAALSEALRLCPAENRWIPLAQFGHLYKQKGEYDEAAAWFRQVIEAAPWDATGRIYLGGILALRGRLPEAEAIYREATEECFDGCIDEAFLNLGFVLRAQERFAEAAACFRDALQIDPHYRAASRALRDAERCLVESEAQSAEGGPLP